MTTAPLEDRRENFMHRLDEVGLGLIGAGVAGAMLKHKFGPKLNASWAAENLGTLGKHLDPHAAMDVLHSLPAEAVVRNTGWRGALGRAGEGLAAHGHAMDLVGLGLITPTAMGYIANKVHPDAPAGELPKVAYALGAGEALRKLGLDQKSKGGYSKKETRELYPEARGRGLKERHEGLNEELEHRDITRGNDARTKKIVDAHLEERPDYYSRLSRAMR
jgi:hypothetical protein